MRPGNNVSSTRKVSATLRALACWSITPPAPTRIRDVRAATWPISTSGLDPRSEERRVGKECGYGASARVSQQIPTPDVRELVEQHYETPLVAPLRGVRGKHVGKCR